MPTANKTTIYDVLNAMFSNPSPLSGGLSVRTTGDYDRYWLDDKADPTLPWQSSADLTQSSILGITIKAIPEGPDNWPLAWELENGLRFKTLQGAQLAVESALFQFILPSFAPLIDVWIKMCPQRMYVEDKDGNIDWIASLQDTLRATLFEMPPDVLAGDAAQVARDKSQRSDDDGMTIIEEVLPI